MKTKSMRRPLPGMIIVAALALGLGGALAQETPAQDTQTAIELNKLEAQGQGCRIYFKVANKAPAYEVLKLDLVLFRPDGEIERRFAVDLGPLKADKTMVKLFDIDGTACDQIGNFLINDVMECKAESGPVGDCLKSISVSSRANVKLDK